MSLLLVTKTLEVAPKGGRELLCKLNHDVLSEIYGKQFFLFELPVTRLTSVSTKINAFKGYIDGLDYKSFESILELIQREYIEKVFLDGSNLGELARFIKCSIPSIEVITFFHNIETRFFLGALRQNKSLHSLGVLIANYLAERKAVRYSDKRICLNHRDSRLLVRLYGKCKTHVSPMALEDKAPLDIDQLHIYDGEPYALFVGGTFYANQAGIEWFVQQVVPHITLKICIVGRGFESLRRKLEVPGKVEVVGAVDSLSTWYRNARFVIAPIFDGSGMKTKVAEALMYGKKVVGTQEAFSGYEEIVDRAGWKCHSIEEFVSAIEEASVQITQAYEPDLREIFIQKYSLFAARTRFENIINGG